MKRRLFISLALLLIPFAIYSQDKNFTLGGFVRGGLYLSTGDYAYDVNAAYGDASLTLTATDNLSFKGFADIRARTGQQFGSNVNTLSVHEAWGMYYNNFMGISLGKKIIKWGKTDIFTPLSRFNPTDYTYRSPEFEDKDMGNLVGELVLTPAQFIRFSAVAAPFWNPSVLITAPMELPEYISLNIPEGFYTDNGYSSIGLRTDLTLRGLDAGIQWYHGPDLIPGLSLTGLDLSDLANPSITITGVPYIMNQAGFDFETVISQLILRGTLAYSKPVEEKEGNEEIPFPQVEWVTGLEWTPGSLRLTFEYSGKKVLDFYESEYDPLIGSGFDISQLAELFAVPGFDPEEFIRLETEAFGRLYNNQMYEYYHSVGLRLSADLLYDRLTPSLTTKYNFTSRDLLLMPSIEYKPTDGLTLAAGLEYYSGKEGGLYDIIDDFMDAAYLSVKVEF